MPIKWSMSNVNSRVVMHTVPTASTREVECQQLSKSSRKCLRGVQYYARDLQDMPTLIHAGAPLFSA